MLVPFLCDKIFNTRYDEMIVQKRCPQRLCILCRFLASSSPVHSTMDLQYIELELELQAFVMIQ